MYDPQRNSESWCATTPPSKPDLTTIWRCRRDHNRLGYLMMVCYLRHPGRVVRAGGCPPPALLGFVADQIDLIPDAFDSSAFTERSRQRYSAEFHDHLGLRPFGRRAAAELTSVLLAPAIENDRLLTLVALALQSCRERRIVLPSPEALEPLYANLRHWARWEAHRRLCHGLPAEHRKGLDGLARRREDTGQNWLTWLWQMPRATKPKSMLGLIARLQHIHTPGINTGRNHLIH